MQTRLLTHSMVALGAVSFLAASANGAFIVEPRSGGKAFANFSANGTPSTSTTSSAALGLTPGIGSIFGGTNATQDIYTYSYTPGTNTDNTVYTAGTDLGDGNLATGIVGGGSASYNVYATWPTTNNISNSGQTTNYVASSDGTAASLTISQDTDNNPGVGNDWVLIGTVQLTAGQTYTVTQTAPDSAFVSMRAAGVMWERVTPVPEPAALGVFALAATGLLARRQRH